MIRGKKVYYFLIITLLTLFMVGCGNEEVHTHEFSDVYSTNATHHWYAAICEHTDEKKDYVEHTFGNWNVTVEPTETEKGKQTRECSVCSYTEEKVIPELNHEHNYTSSVVEPTCEEKGYTLYICSCGDTYKDNFVDALGHTYSNEIEFNETHHWYDSTCGHSDAKKDYERHNYKSEVTLATCTTQGYTTYTCDCGYSYVDDYVNALGHTYSDELKYNDSYHWYEATCDHNTEMKDYEKHNYKKEVTLATCTTQGYTTYTCDCGHSYKADYVDELGHLVELWSEKSSSLYDITNCNYVVTYTGTCEHCNEPLTKHDYIVKHSFYIETVTKATCSTEGLHHQHCSNVGCIYNTTEYAVNNYEDQEAHNWLVDTVSSTETVTYHYCGNECGAAKKSVISTGSSVSVNKDDLNDINEVQLSDVTIALDEGIKTNLSNSNNVNISAENLSTEAKEEAITNSNLSEEDKALLGDSDIYNFTLETTEQVSQLGGTAVIKLPYELNGEDPNNIIVWYISDGELTPIQATYSEDINGKGFVTFSTDHFSYYTVTKLTPAQTCKYYGHSSEVHVVEPTCTTGGYTICLRCSEQIAKTDALGHEWHTEVTKEATCSENGTTTSSCVNCDLTYESVNPASGHYYVVKEQVNATCKESGKVVHNCVYCEDEYQVTLPQLAHNYHTNVVNPTCTADGYTEKTCKSCGETTYSNLVDALGHKFDSAWKAVEEGHYHICLTCGESGELAAHTPGAEATEQNAQICTECEYIIVPQLTHTHKLTKYEAKEATCTEAGNIAYYVCECGKWFADEKATQLITNHLSVIVLAQGHTHETLEYVMPTCTEVGYTAGIKCSVCDVILKGHNEIAATGHDYYATVVPATCTEAGHTDYKCNYCDDEYVDDNVEALQHNYLVTVKAPTCTEGGFTTHTCTRCNDSFTDNEKPALGHNYSKTWSSDETGHWHECTRCDEVADKENHNKDYEEATTEHGVSCTVCNYLIAEILEHTHAPLKTVEAKEPTCEEIGNVEYHICACGNWYYDETCTQIVEKRTDIIIFAKGHNYVANVIEPTCLESGYTQYTCECGSSYKNNYTEALGHIYGEWVVTDPATCLEEGKQVKYCENCDHSVDEVIEALGHELTKYEAKEPTCTEAGHNAYEECSRCDYTTYEELEALGHELTKYEGKEATCTEAGYKAYEECSRCDHTTYEVIEALGHELTKYEAKEATCTEKGHNAYEECSRCDYTTYEEVEALGHNYENGVCTNCENEEPGQGNIQYTWTDEYVNEEGIIEAKAIYEFLSDGVLTGKLYELNDNGELVLSEEDTAYWVKEDNFIIMSMNNDFTEIFGRMIINEDGTLSLYSCEEGGHEYIEIYEEPTCTEDGFKGKECKWCGMGSGTSVPALGHEYENGKCIRCGEEGSNEEVKIQYTYTYEETDENGTIEYRIIYKFQSNGIVRGELYELDSTGELVLADEAEAYWYKEGNLIFICEDEECTYADEVMIINEDGTVSPYECTEHVYEEYYEAPTCTESGTKGKACIICGQGEGSYIPALGHDYVDGKCIRCGHQEGEISLDEYKEAAYNAIKLLWSSVEQNYELTEEQYITYKKYINKIDNATSKEELEMLIADFQVFINEIKESQGTNKETLYVFQMDEYSQDQTMIARYIVNFFNDYTGEFTVYLIYTESGEQQLAEKMNIYWVERYYNDQKLVSMYSDIEHTDCGGTFVVGADNQLTPYECVEHDYVKEHKEPTCTEEGYDRSFCTMCGSGMGTIIPALGHEYDESGLCIRCNAEQGSDSSFEDYKNERIETVKQEWEYICNNYDVLEEYHDKYKQLYSMLMRATTQSEVDDYVEQVYYLFDEIKNNQGVVNPDQKIQYTFTIENVDDAGNIINKVVYNFYSNGIAVGQMFALNDNGEFELGGEVEVYWGYKGEFIYLYIDEAHSQSIGSFIVNADGSLTLNQCEEHEYVDVYKEPTCTEEGYEGQECVKCGMGVKTVYAPLGHDYVDGKCTRCGSEGENEENDLEMYKQEIAKDFMNRWKEIDSNYELDEQYDDLYNYYIMSVYNSMNTDALEAYVEMFDRLVEQIYAYSDVNFDLELTKLDIIYEVTNDWYNLSNKFNINDEYRYQYYNILTNTVNAKEIEEAEKYYEEFMMLVEKIQNNPGETNDYVVNMYLEKEEYELPQGYDLKRFIEENIIGSYLYVVYSQSGTQVVSVDWSMIKFEDYDTNELGTFYIEFNYQTDAYAYNDSIRINVVVDMGNATMTGKYETVEGEFPSVLLIETFDNGYAYIYNDGSKMESTYTLEDNVLTVLMWDMKYIFKVNDNGYSLSLYVPNEEEIGTYVYSEDSFRITFTVYGKYSGKGEYIAVVEEMDIYDDGTTEAYKLTSTVILDLEASYFYSEGFDCDMYFDETGNLYLKECDHKYNVTEKIPTCQEEGYREYYCTNCGDSYREYTGFLDHEYDENGVCIYCGNGNVDVSFEETKQNFLNDMNNQWKEVVNKFEVISEYHVRFKELYEGLRNSYSYDEINMYYNEFKMLVEEIRNNQGSNPDVEVKVEYTFEYEVINEGKLYSKVIYSFYSNSTAVGEAYMVTDTGEFEYAGGINLYWRQENNYLCLYHDENYAVLAGRLIINEDNSLTMYVCDEHQMIVGEYIEPTCTEPGYEYTYCTMCGMGTGQSIDSLGHEYDENGVCIRCEGNGEGTDSEFDFYKQEKYEQMKYEWNEVLNKINVSEEYHNRFKEYMEKINYTYTYDEVNIVFDEFMNFINEVINNQGGSDDYLTNCYLQNTNYVISQGTDIEEFISENIVGTYLYLEYSQSGTQEIEITRDMIRYDYIDTNELGTYHLYIYYSTDGFSGEMGVRIEVVIDMSTATLIATYTTDEAYFERMTINLYDNGFAEFEGVEMPYELQEGILFLESYGVIMIFAVNEETKTISVYYPEEECIGTYVYSESDYMTLEFVVYGTYTGNGDYMAVLNQCAIYSDGTMFKATFTTYVTLDLEAMTLYSGVFGRDMGIDEGNNLYMKQCEHEYVVEEKEATCTSEGYKNQTCTKCGIGSASITPMIPHKVDAAGNCVNCGQYVGNDEVIDTFEQDKEAKLNDMIAEWNYMNEMQYNINEEHYARYSSLCENVKCSTSYDEMDMYVKEFYLLVEEIRNSQCEEHMFEQTVLAPTCTQMGEEINKCVNCGHTETIYIEKLVHEYGEDGNCVNCGNSMAENGDVTQFPADGVVGVN